MMGAIRLTQLDGKLPNLALMKLARYHRERGDDVHFSRSPYRGMFEPDYERVYGSAIFDFSADRVARMRHEFQGAVIGGTWDRDDDTTVEDLIGPVPDHAVTYDGVARPDFTASIGFTARGCRLKCKFCVVPGKEGPPKPVATVAEIWRGEPFPRHLHLIDNDFFGQPREAWEARIEEMRAGRFRVCFNQGINVRIIDDAAAAALASVDYRDDGFTTRRLYTAWDNIGDERRFLDGVERLAAHGIPPTHLLAYMLIGYDRRETWERLFHRHNRMVALGIRPYPMVYGDRHRRLPLGVCNQRIEGRTLGEYARWVIRKAYNFVEFENYDVNAKGRAETRQCQLEMGLA
jgi:hypothetical protein